MKKFRIILCILFLFVFCINSFGCKNETRTYKIEKLDNPVAELTIFTFDGKSESAYGLANLGHSFLSVYNRSNEDILIGDYMLEVGETICVGTWSINQHFGVWYNLESNYIRVCDKYLGRVSVTKYLSEQDVEEITSFIKQNDKWNPLFNCSCFAINLWNAVAKENEILNTYLIYTPNKLAEQLKQFKNYKINMHIKTKNEFGYFSEGVYKQFHLQGDINV